MVEAHYVGRLGNQLFTYCYSRLVAERLGLRLVCEPIPGFDGTCASVDGDELSDPITAIVDFDILHPDAVPRSKVEVRGFMQRAEYYVQSRQKIKSWLATDASQFKPGHDDLVVPVRLGDFTIMNWVLDFDYYRRVVSQEKYKTIWVTTDQPEHPYLNQFNEFDNVKYFRAEPLEHFKFIRDARNIALCRSTFSWWAAFVSNAQKIYYPVMTEQTHAWTNVHANVVDLLVDSPEYITVPASTWDGSTMNTYGAIFSSQNAK